MKRAVRGEVVASSLDREIESHVRLSQFVIETVQTPCGNGQGRRSAARFDHPIGPCIQ